MREDLSKKSTEELFKELEDIKKARKMLDIREEKKSEIKNVINTPQKDIKKFQKAKGMLIGSLITLAIVYGLNWERIQEALSTIIHEGPENFIEQTENYLNQEKESEKTISIEDTYKDKKNTNDDFSIKPIGDTIREDANYFRVPLIINLSKENRFNYRNRGDKRDLNNTDGAMMSVFKPFCRVEKYKTLLSKDKNTSTVIALNTKTGMLSVGNFDEFKENSDYVVSETRAPKKIIDIEINHQKAKYNQNIYQKGIILILQDSSKTEFPIGIGKDKGANSSYGNDLLGYSGGKVLIFSPDKKNGRCIYGTANMIKEQIKNFKETYGVEYVLWYDLDQKSYSQTIQTKNKKISGKQLIELDNKNSAASGSGNILYLDNELHH